ncbi:hypothetical protein HOD30_02580 [Candidatus Peregrinibacteria bacterium]|jgi:hypothetical protein|nr:hypothetical protein [Candidatus Peregrinibacteria bacterium]MBT4631554.1 hypothetical protein [Candidatus Peregrinibacteria bacterium]MBT5823539.1 hypothetical protein [Candidatus Peregrinibacteria bacterium]
MSPLESVPSQPSGEVTYENIIDVLIIGQSYELQRDFALTASGNRWMSILLEAGWQFRVLSLTKGNVNGVRIQIGELKIECSLHNLIGMNVKEA